MAFLSLPHLLLLPPPSSVQLLHLLPGWAAKEIKLSTTVQLCPPPRVPRCDLKKIVCARVTEGTPRGGETELGREHLLARLRGGGLHLQGEGQDASASIEPQCFQLGCTGDSETSLSPFLAVHEMPSLAQCLECRVPVWQTRAVSTLQVLSLREEHMPRAPEHLIMLIKLFPSHSAAARLLPRPGPVILGYQI